jgi:hypothetical protein
MAVVAGMWALGRVARLTGSIRATRWYPVLAVPVIGANLINVPLDPAIRDRAIYWVAAVVVIGGALAGLLAAQRMPARVVGGLVQVAAMAGIVVAMVAWPFYVADYDDRRLAEWRAQIQGFSLAPEAWAWLEAETAGGEQVIAVAGTNEVFPLYGLELENRVVTIWHSGELAEYGWYEPFVLYGAPDRAAWLAQIKDAQVNYVVVTENVSFGGWPEERAWMMEAPERFARAFANAEIEIWEVLDEGGQTARYSDRQGRLIQFDWHVH